MMGPELSLISESMAQNQTSRSPFLRLPAEIRQLIYSFLYSQTLSGFTAYDESTQPQNSAISLLFTCRTLFVECSALAFRHTALHLDEPGLERDGLDLEDDILHCDHPPDQDCTCTDKSLAIRFYSRQEDTRHIYVTADRPWRLGPFQVWRDLRGENFVNLTRIVLTWSIDMYRACVGEIIAFRPTVRVIVLVDSPRRDSEGYVKSSLWNQLEKFSWLWEAVETNLEWNARLSQTFIAHKKWRGKAGCFGVTTSANLEGRGIGNYNHTHVYYCDERDVDRVATLPWTNSCPVELSSTGEKLKSNYSYAAKDVNRGFSFGPKRIRTE